MRVEPVIDLLHVSRSFAGPPAVQALRDASLEVSRGEYVAIMGRSGSGKSTLLNILGLLDRPSGGTYYLMGQSATDLNARSRDRLRGKHIGFVFQTSHLINTRSVYDNVRLGLTLAGIPRGTRGTKAFASLDSVGLSHRANASSSTLSGGERQRAVIARTIAKQPEVLLCDEPTGDLDSATTHEILDVLDDLRTRAQTTIVMITHDPGVARRADRVLTIEDGVLAS